MMDQFTRAEMVDLKNDGLIHWNSKSTQLQLILFLVESINLHEILYGANNSEQEQSSDSKKA